MNSIPGSGHNLICRLAWCLLNGLGGPDLWFLVAAGDRC
jgi:hypothetical protein